MASGGTTVVTERTGLQFLPYLLDIGNWAKIFSGGNATLFTYELPVLDFQFVFQEMLATIPIPFPPLSWISLNIGAVGRARAFVDLSFGVDTFGVQKAMQTGNVFDVVDSFYVNDWTLPTIRNGAIVPGTGGKEKPEFGIELEIGLLGGVGVTGVMSGGIGGSITMRVDADLNDIKRGTIVRDENGQVTSVSYRGDGRVRLSEIGTMMLYPGVIPFTNISTGIPGGPLNLFDLTFSGGISPYVWVNTFVTGTMAFKLFTVPLPSITLAAPTVKPTLGQVSNGVLTLNAGPRAADRLWVNTADSGENFILSGMGGGVVDVEFDSFVVRYTGVSKVVVDLGAGNDTLDASRLFDTTVSLDVRGGDGNDTVLFGTGGGVAVDLAGRNSLDASRSQKSVTLVGGAGDDTLTGGLADDILLGGDGTNVLNGGAGDDWMYALAGINRLSGGRGVDRYVFVGAVGANRILGETDEEVSDLDFSGAVPTALLALVGPPANLPTVSIPLEFGALRPVGETRFTSDLRFYGKPFGGPTDRDLSVTLRVGSGTVVAASGGGVTVSGSDTERIFTGRLDKLNAYFTTPGKVRYTFAADTAEQDLAVEIRVDSALNTVRSKIRAGAATAEVLGWTDIALSPDRQVAVSVASKDSGGAVGGIYLSEDGGVSWSLATDAPKGVDYSSVAISADGLTIVATVSGGGVVSSADGGKTWKTTQAIALQGSPFLGGSATVELYQSIAGTRVSDLTFSNSGFTLPATRLAEMSGAFDYSAQADTYGARISGWITPPETGNYQLWIAGDDAAELWLDASGTGEGALAQVASVDAAVGRHNWTKSPGQRSASVLLEKGKLYRFEVLHKEGFGGDFVQVGWSNAGSTAVQVVPGSWLVAGHTPDELTVTLSLPSGGSGTISGDTVPGLDVTVGGSGGQRTFTGSLPALHAYFTQPGNIRFTGEARTLDVRVTSASQAPEAVTLAPMLPSGAVTLETWSNLGGTALSTLTGSANFPNNASTVREVALSPVDANGYYGFYVSPGGDNYGARLSGYLAPDESGPMHLLLTADDTAELWVDLSETGQGPLTRVAEVTRALGVGDWTKTAGQKSDAISLEKGRLYRFEVLLKEGSGADFVRVGFQKPGTTTVQALPAHWVLPDLPTALSVTLTAPAGGVVVVGGSDRAGGVANSPSNAGPLNVLDGDADSKYLNRDKVHTGLVFAYPQAYAADTLRLVSANDAPERDPTQFVLYGSNTSADWADTGWIPVASGATGLGTARGTANEIALDNAQAYHYYKVVFPTLRDAGRAAGMQIADVTLFGGGRSLATIPYGTVDAQPAEGLTVTGEGVSRTLSGDLHALHRYLSTVGNVQFTGVGTQLQVSVTGTPTLAPVEVQPSLVTGSVTLEVWDNLGGTALSGLTGSPLYPNLTS